MSKYIRDFIVSEAKVVKKDNKYIVAGRFGKAENVNENDRIYKRCLWKNILKRPSVINSLCNRTMLGELGHPDYIEPSMFNSSHIVTSLVLQPDDVIYGEAEILDTPAGKILKILLDAGVKLGISSRGFVPEDAEVERIGEAYVVPDSYELVTFDFVLNPSDQGAFPSLKESVQTEIRRILSESKSRFEAKTFSMLEGVTTTKKQNKIVVEEDVNKLMLSFSKKESKNSFKDKVLATVEGIDVSEQESGNLLISFLDSSKEVLAEAKVKRLLNRSFKDSLVVAKRITSEGVADLQLTSLFSKLVSESKAKKEENTLKVTTEETENNLPKEYDLAVKVINQLILDNTNLEKEVSSNKENLATLEGKLSATKTADSKQEEGNKVLLNVISEMRTRYLTSEKVVKELRDNVLSAEALISELRDYALTLEDAVSGLVDANNSITAALKEASEGNTLSTEVSEKLKEFNIDLSFLNKVKLEKVDNPKLEETENKKDKLLTSEELLTNEDLSVDIDTTETSTNEESADTVEGLVKELGISEGSAKLLVSRYLSVDKIPNRVIDKIKERKYSQYPNLNKKNESVSENVKDIEDKHSSKESATLIDIVHRML